MYIRDSVRDSASPRRDSETLRLVHRRHARTTRTLNTKIAAAKIAPTENPPPIETYVSHHSTKPVAMVSFFAFATNAKNDVENCS